MCVNHVRCLVTLLKMILQQQYAHVILVIIGLRVKMLYLVQVSRVNVINNVYTYVCVLVFTYVHTGPPSAPHNLNVLNVTNTTVFLQWDSPLDNGNRLDLFYTISQNISSITYTTTNTTFLLEDLLPFTYYEVHVTAGNGVSSQDNAVNDRTISVQVVTSQISK